MRTGIGNNVAYLLLFHTFFKITIARCALRAHHCTMYVPQGRSSRCSNTQTGAAVLAALILVGAVGVLSVALHYLNPGYDMAYQPRALTANAVDVANAPNITPSATKVSTVPGCDALSDHVMSGPRAGDKYCKCISPRKSTVSPSPTVTAANGGTTNQNVQADGLPSCKYMYNRNNGTLTPIPQDSVSTSKTDPSKGYEICFASLIPGDQNLTCVTQKPGEGASAPSVSGAGAPGTSPSQPSAAATAAAQDIFSAAAKGGASGATEAYNKTNDAIASGILPSDLQNALNQQYASAGEGSKHDAAPVLQGDSGILNQLNALAGQQETDINMNPGCVGSNCTTPGDATVPPLAGGCAASDLNCKAGMGNPVGNPPPGQQPPPVPPLGGGEGPPPQYQPNPYQQQGSTFGGGMGSIGAFLSGLARGFGGSGMGGGRGGNGIPAGNSIPQAPGSCNTKYICSGQTLLYRNNQCVDQPVQQCQYGCNGSSCAQSNNQYNQGNGQYGYGTDGQPCMQPPTQPLASTCTVGTWKAVSATNNKCTTGWQCVPSGSNSSGAPVASLSCQSQVADVGSTFGISYACQNSTGSIGGGFYTGGQLSGSTSTIIAIPPAGYDTATYSLGCSNGNATVGAQCSVQINNPQIILTASPNTVILGATSTIGWVTSGMQSCVISSPDLPDFTAQNANHTSVNGVAVTPSLTVSARMLLSCKTLAGGTRQATTTVTVH